MKIHILEPDFNCSYMYEEFYQKVGGKYWIDLNKAVEKLQESLRLDRDFTLSMANFYGYETKDEQATIEITPTDIVISFSSLARKVEYNKVTKKVVVEGDEFTREIFVCKEHEWCFIKNERTIPYSIIKTAD